MLALELLLAIAAAAVKDYMTAIFSRNDSLMTLAKIVDAVIGTTDNMHHRL